MRKEILPKINTEDKEIKEIMEKLLADGPHRVHIVAAQRLDGAVVKKLAAVLSKNHEKR